MTRAEIVERLCKLQAEVWDQLFDPAGHSADCFCGQGGFWRDPEGGFSEWYTEENGFRNEGGPIEFIENTVREKLASLRGPAPTDGQED